MGKMRIGSAGNDMAVASAPVVQSVPQYVETERVIEVEIPKPVTKEVIVEIPKPVYKIVEVEEKVQKPKIKVEEVTQSVIKPVFSIKTETIVLDQMQKKLDESVSLASTKLEKLNSVVVEQSAGTEKLEKEVSSLRAELKSVKTLVVVSALAGLAAALVSLLG